ncbi:MAG: FtsQ-type POTRA domain-containing protein [Thiolinea sp.]
MVNRMVQRRQTGKKLKQQPRTRVAAKNQLSSKRQFKNPLRSVSLSPRMVNALLAVAVLMVVAGAVMWSVSWLNKPENLPIQKVELKGRLQYADQAELQAIIEPYIATNLYLLDAEALEQDLEAHPWIRSVSLNKAWPDQLFINLEEQYPVAFWGKEHLLNKFGEIFPGELAGKADVFPTVYSPADKGREMAERYVELAGLLDGLGLEIVELTEDDRGTWRMKFRQGPEVIIGREEQKKRVQRFRVGYMQELRAKFSEVRRIDLRYTNGFAVEWKQGSDQIGAVSSLDNRLPERLRS